MDGDSAGTVRKRGLYSSSECQYHKGNDLYPCTGKGSGDDYVMVSENAASQPEVKLNLKEGEQLLPGRSSLFFNVEKP